MHGRSGSRLCRHGASRGATLDRLPVPDHVLLRYRAHLPGTCARSHHPRSRSAPVAGRHARYGLCRGTDTRAVGAQPLHGQSASQVARGGRCASAGRGVRRPRVPGPGAGARGGLTRCRGRGRHHPHRSAGDLDRGVRQASHRAGHAPNTDLLRTRRGDLTAGHRRGPCLGRRLEVGLPGAGRLLCGDGAGYRSPSAGRRTRSGEHPSAAIPRSADLGSRSAGRDAGGHVLLHRSRAHPQHLAGRVPSGDVRFEPRRRGSRPGPVLRGDDGGAAGVGAPDPPSGGFEDPRRLVRTHGGLHRGDGLRALVRRLRGLHLSGRSGGVGLLPDAVQLRKPVPGQVLRPPVLPGHAGGGSERRGVRLCRRPHRRSPGHARGHRPGGDPGRARGGAFVPAAGQASGIVAVDPRTMTEGDPRSGR